MKKRKLTASNHEKANTHEKRSMDHANIIHVLDGCHPCEYYIIMYAYMIIIYIHTDVLCANGATHGTNAVYVNAIFIIIRTMIM